ncbi:WhiB family transcriptional regulator [Actinomadura oligospora]|uniref:WhiB family transcriptional regulator n=1 Tax=Actinomadura oligospora TaxID=111804 RepID=UPI0004BCC362|nr:WhiB family transcriptional regulator [Actinomadura oligospora]
MNLHPSKLSATDLIAAGLVGAECAYDSELHTGPRLVIETTEERAAREDVAKDVCLSCPVRSKCLVRALGVAPRSGVWAAVSAKDISRRSLNTAA